MITTKEALREIDNMKVKYMELYDKCNTITFENKKLEKENKSLLIQVSSFEGVRNKLLAEIKRNSSYGNVKLKQENKKLRGYLAESVCKECKCENNTSVNFDLLESNVKLRQKLKEIEGKAVTK